MDANEVMRRARRRQAGDLRRRLDPRYQRVLGRLVAARLLTTNDPVETHRRRLRVADALWAGEVEPRILELLPALLIKRPALFVDPHDLPDDLAGAVAALRRGRTPEPFRGVEGPLLERWLPVVGHKDKLPSQLRSFRLSLDDTRLLARLSTELGVSQTAVMRRGLHEVALRLGKTS